MPRASRTCRPRRSPRSRRPGRARCSWSHSASFRWPSARWSRARSFGSSGARGRGEAGWLLPRDLVRGGHTVRGWDPDLRGDLAEIPIASSHAAAVDGADVVVSVNWATVAEVVARETAPYLRPGRVYADFN